MLLSTPFASPTANAVGRFKAHVNPQVTQAPLIAKRTSIAGWTSLGPITSLWTPPASCYLTTTTYNGSLYIYDHFTGSIISSISCNPPIPWLPIVTSNAVEFFGPATWTSRYYSPAVCPSGWSTAWDLSQNWQTAVGDNANTAYLCCPTGFSAPTNTLEPCTSYLSSGSTLSNVWSRPTASSQVSIGSSPVMAPSVLKTSQRVDAMPLVVLWQSTDTQILDLLRSISATSSASPTSTGASAPAQNVPLSSAAKGGISAGIAVVFFAIVLGIFCAFRQRGRRVNTDSEDDTQQRRRPNTHELVAPSNKREMITKYNNTEIIDEPRRHTGTHDENGNMNEIPPFPSPPTTRELSVNTKYNVTDMDTGQKYKTGDSYEYSSLPLRSPGLGREMNTERETHLTTNRDTLSPGEQLTPTTYVPPGRAFSAQSTALGPSPSPGHSFSRDSATLGEDGSLYPAPLELGSSNIYSNTKERGRVHSNSPALSGGPGS